MPWTPGSKNQTEIAKNITRPQWLVYMGYSTPIRLTTRDTIAEGGIDSNVWLGADMKVDLSLDGLSGRLQIYDEDWSIITTMLAEGTAGIPVQVYMLYGDGYSGGDEDLRFAGELGQARERDGVIDVALVQPESRWAPNIYINAENGFNHLPPDGTEISTHDGVIVLRRIS